MELCGHWRKGNNSEISPCNPRWWTVPKICLNFNSVTSSIVSYIGIQKWIVFFFSTENTLKFCVGVGVSYIYSKIICLKSASLLRFCVKFLSNSIQPLQSHSKVVWNSLGKMTKSQSQRVRPFAHIIIQNMDFSKLSRKKAKNVADQYLWNIIKIGVWQFDISFGSSVSSQALWTHYAKMTE